MSYGAVRSRRATYKYTGRPCKNGHIGPRYGNGNCVQCLLDRERMKYADPSHAEAKKAMERARFHRDPERQRARMATYRSEHREALAKKRRGRYMANRDAIIAQVRAYRQKYPERVAASDRAYRAKHAERRAVVRRAWQERNLDRLKQQRAQRHRLHYAANKAYYWVKAQKRRAIEARATPSWVDRQAMASFYVEAKRLTLETGIHMSVDHIVPLRGKRDGLHVVCGLNVEWNLAVIPLTENKSRSCYHWEDKLA